MDAGRVAVGAVWIATLIGVALVLALSPAPALPVWLALTAALSVVAGMVGQLAVGEQRGFVVRLASAATGSFVVVCFGALAALALR